MIVKSPSVPRFFRVGEVARILGLSDSTVWNMIWAGTLPSVRLSARAVRVDRDELERWLESRRAGR